MVVEFVVIMDALELWKFELAEDAMSEEFEEELAEALFFCKYMSLNFFNLHEFLTFLISGLNAEFGSANAYNMRWIGK